MQNDDDIKIQEIKDYMWRRGNLAWKLWPQQEPIYYGVKGLPVETDLVVILCARQFGKSYLGAIMAIEDCINYPDRAILIVGPTLKQTTEIVAPRIRNIQKDAPRGLITRTKSESKWIVGNSELILGGFDIKSSSQRGKTLQRIYVEEIVESDPDKYIESMSSDLGPALTHSYGGKMIFLTTPPKLPDHPFVTDTMVQAKLQGSLYIYTIDDNTALRKEQYDRCVRLAGGRHTVAFLREYMCHIIRDPEILVIPAFDEKRHVKEINNISEAHWHVTIDWGGVRDKTCAVLHTLDFDNDKLLFQDVRVFDPNTPTDIIVKGVREMECGRKVTRYADVPGQLKVDLQSLHGFEVMTPPKTDWKAAINALSVRFSLDKALINPRCKFLIESCNSGMFNVNKTDFARTNALGHMDGLAAMMYANRVQRTDSPYDAISVSSDSYFRIMAKEEKLISPFSSQKFSKQFVHKKFGSFAK